MHLLFIEKLGNKTAKRPSYPLERSSETGRYSPGRPNGEELLAYEGGFANLQIKKRPLSGLFFMHFWIVKLWHLDQFH